MISPGLALLLQGLVSWAHGDATAPLSLLASALLWRVSFGTPSGARVRLNRPEAVPGTRLSRRGRDAVPVKCHQFR